MPTAEAEGQAWDRKGLGCPCASCSAEQAEVEAGSGTKGH